MLKILDTDQLKDKLPFVTSPNIFTHDGKYDDHGLFSETIFGSTRVERGKKMALIDLNCRIIHPDIFRMLKRLNSMIEEIVLLKDRFIFQDGIIQRDRSGRNGMSFLLEIWDDLTFRGGTPEREKIIAFIKQKLKPTQIFCRYLLVLPPAIRPVSSEVKQLSPINEAYVKIIKLSLQIKISTPELVDPLIAELQKTCNTLWDILSQINKKSGLVRHDLLGKRVDFSARAVVAPGADLPYGKIGVPLKIVVKIFEPFIIHQLLKKNDNPEQFAKLLKQYDLSFNYKGITSILKMISNGYIKPGDDIYQFVKRHAEQAIVDKVVIFKRDPALHRLSLQAAYVVITDEDVVRIPPYHIEMLNMDFDGDTCALFVPLSDEAQEEAKKKILSNISTPTNIGIPWPSIKNDVYAGIYLLTK